MSREGAGRYNHRVRRLWGWLWKIALAGLVFLGLAALAAPYLVKRFLPPEKIRELILTQGGKALGREIKLGSVSYGLVKGVELRDLVVSEAPDFKAGEFAAARALSLRLQWLALLRKQVAIDSVSADGLRLSIVKRKDGLYNFSSLAGSTVSVAGPGTGPAGPAFALAVSRARLSGARISYEDLVTGDSVALSELDLSLRHFSLKGPFDAEVSCKSSGRWRHHPVNGGFTLAGRFDLGGQDPRQVSADLKKLSVEYAGHRLSLSGKIRGLSRPALVLRFALAGTEGELVSGEWDGTAVVPDAKTPLSAEGAFKLKTPGFDTAALKGLGADLPRAKLPALSASGKVAYGGDAVKFAALTIEPAQGKLELFGSIAGLATKKPRVDLAVAGDLTLPELKAADFPNGTLPAGLVVPASSLRVKAAVKGEDVALDTLSVKSKLGSVVVSGKASGVQSVKPDYDMEAGFDLDLPAFTAADAPLLSLPAGTAVPALKIKGQARARGEDLTLASLRVASTWGTVDASGSIGKFSSKKPQVDLEAALKLDLPPLKASQLPVTGFPKDYETPAVAVSGKVRVQGDDVFLAPLSLRFKTGTVDISGRVARAIAGEMNPEVDVAAKLDLPAVRSQDVPHSSVPAGLVVPPSKWDAAFFASRDELKIKSLRVVIGKNDVEIDGGRIVQLRSGNPLFSVLVKCRSFSLDELTQFSPQTRELGLTGGGFFAVDVVGRLPKPIVQGKAQFKGLGATVAGLTLADFTGTASFNEKRIDIPNLRGRLADGHLEVDFTARDYTTAPKIDLHASLDRFDLGTFFAAKEALAAKKSAKTAAAPVAVPVAQKPTPVALSGKLEVAELIHPNAQAKDLRLFWDLTEATPDLKSLDGTAKFSVTTGKFTGLGKLAVQSRIAKILLSPLLAIGTIGTVIKVFPDFNNVIFTEMAGDYAFSDGIMTLNDSHVYSSAFDIKAAGTVNLPAETQNLTVTAKVGALAPIEVEVKGTFDKPISKLKLGKAVVEGAKNLIPGLFKK